MKNFRSFTAIIEKENNGYVSLCPELDLASQGDTIEEARNNLQEAIELFFEHASKDEITSRLRNEFFITNMQIAVG
jgi:predicted RNase H-like HicB family nuclease